MPVAPYDIVIAGSGAAGSLLAAKLAQAGKRVVILEAGPEVTTADMVSSQIWSRRIHGTPISVTSTGANPVGVGFNSGWGTGGSAAHHYACWFRLHEDDFRFRTTHGAGLDWPVGYDELRPYYDRIQAEVGISGDDETDIWSPPHDPYPQPALPILTQGEVLKRGFDALGIATSPTPQAILSRRMGDRAACLLDGWCDAGCPIGALANPQVTYLREALAAGVTLIHDARVTRVLTTESGERATGVEYIDGAGARQELSADWVALGAYAIETPRILLHSATPAHPGGLANGGGLVGAHIMTHIGSEIFGLVEEDVKPYMGRSGGELWSQAQYASDAANGYTGGYQWLGATASKPNDLLGVAMSRPDLIGQPLVDFLQTASHRMINASFIGNDLPLESNRVSLGEDVDATGVPLPVVTHAFGPDQLAIREAGLKLGQEIMRAAGATEVWVNPNANQHIMGGAIMGDDPAKSVTNSYGICHEVPNLAVLGSSLFPTSGGVNPTFTIHALTLRTAEHLIENWDPAS